ncbi:hypothetical protein [Sphingobacterium anhuiense]|uniref:hypothetical protein n=1 Tax=Sphingobacterium anhuiense TaxID=493780 RepID=UPI003C2C0869
MKYLFSGLLCLLTMNILAQEERPKRKYPALEVIYFAGIQFNDASNLNTLLKESGAGQVPGFGWNAGVGTAYRINQTLIGVNFSLSTSGKKNNTLKTGDFTMYVSTNAIRTGKFIFSPQLGFGPRFSNFTIEKQNMNGTFQDFLTNQSNETKLEHTASIVDLSVALKTTNVDRTLLTPKCRIGYKSSISVNEWKVANATVTNASKDRLGTFYLQLAWGIGR